MELKYNVAERSSQLESSKLTGSHSIAGVCAVSSENIIVFTRVQYHSNSFKNAIPIYTVYASDLNTPYECHKILESLVKITHLVFSTNGQELLIVTSLGYVHYYVKGPGLHQWDDTHTSNWTGEDILYANFFHQESKPIIQMKDIKVNSPYAEKFSCRSHKPTLVNIGGCPQSGFFAISASGLILICILCPNGSLEKECKAVLGPVRDNFLLACASFSPSGHIHISAWKPEIIKCWKVKLSFSEKEEESSKDDGTKKSPFLSIDSQDLNIDVQSAKSFSPTNLDSKGYAAIDSRNVRVVQLLYIEQEDPSGLLVVLEVELNKLDSSETKAGHSSSSKNEADESQHNYLVQRYQLQEKSRPLLKLFQLSVSTESTNHSTLIKEWSCVGEWVSNHRIKSICTPPRQLCPGTQIPYVIVVTTVNGTIYTINKESMLQLNKFSCQSRSEEMPPPKKFASDRYFVTCASTWTSLHLVALDSHGSLHLFSLLKQADIGSSWAVYIILVLEYSLVSDYDWMDILMAMPPNSAQTLSDRLTETFNQHPSQLANHLLTKFLILKNSMLRLSANLHQKSIEVRLQAQLSAILKLFHSFRPVTTDMISQEKNFHTIIETFIESRASLEILDIEKALDQMLFSCNILDCQIDPSLVQDLQTLLQFTTDLSLYLLLLLVQNSKYGLAKEPKILQYLREILFVARLWFRHNKLVVPQVFKKSDSVDIWAQLYKLLTRLAQIIPNEPDTAFIDECIVLETQVVCRELPLFIPPRGVLGSIASPPSIALPYPIQFYFEQSDPNCSVSSVNPRPLEGSLPSPHPLDPLYYHFLGANGPLFQCSRCFAVRGSWWGVGDYVSMWEQEWAHRCVCSGMWAPAISPTRLLRTT